MLQSSSPRRAAEAFMRVRREVRSCPQHVLPGAQVPGNDENLRYIEDGPLYVEFRLLPLTDQAMMLSVVPLDS